MKDQPDLLLTPKSVLMFEKLTGKKMSSLDNEEDIATFMYCIFVCSTGKKITKGAFLILMENKKFSAYIQEQFKRIWGYTSQFSPQKTDKNIAEGEEGETVSMTDYITTLIVEYQISADYVLNKMDLWELEGFYKAAESRLHAEMEDKRLWAYLQMLPNLDKKHRDMTPQKFLPFMWEQDEIKKANEKKLEEETARAKSILGMNINDLLGKKENNG